MGGWLARRRRWVWAGALVGAALALLAWVRCGPLPPDLLDEGRHLSTRVVDRHGEVLYESLSEAGGRSRWLGPDALPPMVVRATLAAEDRRFFRHPGVDPLAVGRAAWDDLRALRIVEGGSTLTQQVVKRLTARRRTVPGKLREMLLALRLEHRLSKREILALYLNLAPYGNQYAGVAGASRGYFGCPPENLTAAQAAFLAGLPQRPSAFDPYRHMDRALRRQRWVLARMAETGALDGAALRRAEAERLRLVRAPKAFAAPHFVQEVLSDPSLAGASRIETTLDAGLQREVEGILGMQRADLLRHGAHSAAVAVMNNRTGEWLAWEGSGDYADTAHGGAIDGVLTPRQPGSALKPFTYALAFEKGFTPASILPDVPAHFPTAEPGVLYSPRNYDGVFRGPMRARLALAGSENVPAVWLLSRIGAPDLLRLLRRAGFSTLHRNADYYGFGLTLGDAEVTLADLVAGYAALSRGGVAVHPLGVTGARWEDGLSRSWSPASGDRLVSERAAFWVTDILSDPNARAYIFGRGGSLDFPFPVAVKTGTSQAYRDNWTVGYTRAVTVGVWVGNFDRSELVGSSGVTGAGPIFHAVLLAAEKRAEGRLPGPADPPLAEPPPGLARLPICALSGMAATPACPQVEEEWLPADHPPAPCTWHRGRGRDAATAWPVAYRTWARERGLVREASPGPPAERGHDGAGPARPLRILNPPDGAIYLIDPTLRPSFQTLPLRAAVEGAPGPLFWSVDGKAVGESRSDGTLEWPLEPGRHVISASDGRGHGDRVAVVVR